MRADNRGITLIELIIVISIIGILVVALGFQYAGWQGRYRVESQVREVYADLMDARIRAMQQNRPFGVRFQGATYEAIRATDDAWTSFTIAPGWTTAKRLPVTYQLPWASTVVFNSRGLAGRGVPGDYQWFTDVRLLMTGWNTTNPPDYTCIVVNQTKISLGWTTPQNSMAPGNCIAK